MVSFFVVSLDRESIAVLALPLTIFTCYTLFSLIGFLNSLLTMMCFSLLLLLLNLSAEPYLFLECFEPWLVLEIREELSSDKDNLSGSDLLSIVDGLFFLKFSEYIWCNSFFLSVLVLLISSSVAKSRNTFVEVLFFSYDIFILYSIVVLD